MELAGQQRPWQWPSTVSSAQAEKDNNKDNLLLKFFNN